MEEPNSHVSDEIAELEGEELAQTLEEEISGVTENKAEDLVDEYTNLYTLCWATIYDSEHMQEEFLIKGDYLLDELQENDLHVSYFGQRLHIPDRVPDHKVDIPLESYDGRYDYHQGNMDEWYKATKSGEKNMKTGDTE